jgi:enediyne biosynthesis protein E3
MTILLAGRARRLLFGIPSAKAVAARPGFAPEGWQLFQPVASSVWEGYHAVLDDPRLPVLVDRLEAVGPELKGFAYEGAGLGLAALDAVTPWRKRLDDFVAGPGAPYTYLIYIGVGLAYARLRRSPEANLAGFDPLLGWVIADGYGFHETLFRRRRYVDQHAVPTRLTPYGRRIFDQGVGRALWFSSGAVVERIAGIIAAFQPHRHADLWSGVGLASSYAGGASRAGLRSVVAHAAAYRQQLARGAATAAWGRVKVGNPAAHTDLACEVYCGRDSADAAAVVDDAARDLPVISAEPAFEIWHRRTEEKLAA